MEPLPEAVLPTGRGRAFHALRSRDFRLLWSGQTVSLIGNAAADLSGMDQTKQGSAAARRS